MQSSQAETLPRPRLQTQRFGRTIREIGETVVLIGVLYALVNLASGRFVVEGISMQPNFYAGQYLIVSRVHYLLQDPQRGDIIVFQYPNDPEQDYIKRVIGVPGDTVEIRDLLVYVNGEPLDEPYINEPCIPVDCPNQTWELDEDEFFMMGDNRNHSTDSRKFGPVERHFIIGRAFIRYWTPQDWGILTGYHRTMNDR